MTTHLLSETEEATLAVAVEVGVLAEEALRGGILVDAGADELEALAREGRGARERLLLANVGLVKTIAWAEVSAASAEFDEVVQEGHLALAEALVRYDHRRGRFGPYAAAWVRARIRAAVATQCGRTGVPARDMVRYFAARRAETDLMQCLGRAVTASEVPGGVRMAAVEAVAMPAPLVAALLVPDESASAHLDPQGAPDLIGMLSGLPAAERRVLRRRFGFDGAPAPRHVLAAELGVSEATVRRLEARALTALRRRLGILRAA
ncbi:MAG TPA: sigma-70 family RNA polymerase sigma factor [Propionibacteriaceae bacterium]|nr:sigma-70 family RNA polymerase sigma factor [Propionibacteriaceae bacterium]